MTRRGRGPRQGQRQLQHQQQLLLLLLVVRRPLQLCHKWVYFSSILISFKGNGPIIDDFVCDVHENSRFWGVGAWSWP